MRKQKGWQDILAIILQGLATAAAIILTYALMGWGDVKAAAPSLPAYAEAMEIKYDLPQGMLQAICEQESNWRNVAGGNSEIGVCQLKPDTVRHICPQCYLNARQTFYRAGSTGPVVRAIQARLSFLGLYAGTVDGVYGSQTTSAVLAYQRDVALRGDGIVGPGTWGQLMPNSPYPGGTITAALWNPYTNIEWAAKYLVWLRANVSAEPTVMIAAYNGGPGNSVARYLSQVLARAAKIEPRNRM